MKRKIIQIGNRTKCVTLPQDWVKRFDIKKGDDLEVSEYGDELVLKTKNRGSKTIEVDLRNTNKFTIEESIIAFYQFGYDKIILKYDPEVVNCWNGKIVDTRKVLQDQCNQLIGFECINMNRKEAMIHDIMDVSAEEFEVILKRIFLLLQSYLKDANKGIKENNPELLDFVLEQAQSMRKYLWYCLRYLSKVGAGEKTPNYVYLISMLDKARISLRFIIMLYKETGIKQKYSKETLEIIEKIANLFKEVYGLYNNFSFENSAQIFQNRADCINQCFKLAESKNKADSVISQRFIVVLNTICDISNVCTALNADKVNSQSEIDN